MGKEKREKNIKKRQKLATYIHTPLIFSYRWRWYIGIVSYDRIKHKLSTN